MMSWTYHTPLDDFWKPCFRPHARQPLSLGEIFIEMNGLSKVVGFVAFWLSPALALQKVGVLGLCWVSCGPVEGVRAQRNAL